jgi:hypothetical protein
MASSALTLIAAPFLLFAVVKSAMVIRKNSERLETPEFREKFGTLTEGYRTEHTIGRYWTPIILTRWGNLSIILVVLSDNT